MSFQEAFKSKIASSCFDSAEFLVRAHSELENELQDDNIIVADGAEKVQHFEGQLSSVSDQLEKLEVKYELLEKRIKKLEVSQLVKVKGGQLAFEINRAVVHKVLDGIVDPDEEQINTIGDMEKAFEGESNYDDIFEKEDNVNKAMEK